MDTNSKPVFEQVKNDVFDCTGQVITQNCCEDVKEILSHELTADRAVYVALIHNPELQALYANLGIAKADLAQAGLLKNPIFAFAYRFSTDPLVTNLIDLDLVQNLIETLLIPLKKKMAANELEATRLFVTGKVLEVIADTKSSFYALQAAEQIWILKDQLLLAKDAAVDAANRLFQAGNIKELVLVEKRLEYEQAKVSLANAEMEIMKARENLNVLMGLWGCQISWQPCRVFPAMQDPICHWNKSENRAIEHSFDLQMVRKQLCATAARAGIDTARIVFPGFDGGISTQREDSVWYIGPASSFAIPLFDWGVVNSAAAQAEICQQWNHYTALAIKIRSAARLTRLEVLDAQRRSRFLKGVILPLAEKFTNTTLLQHNAMQIGVFDLLLAKEQEVETKIEAVAAEKEYWMFRTELEMLLNGHMRDS